MTVRSMLRTLTTVATVGLLLVVPACSSDSPSEPRRDPGPPPGQGGGAAVYNVTVTLDPPSAEPGGQNPVLVTVRAVRADNGAPAPTGTVATISALTGAFVTPGGDNSVQVTTTNGTATVNYFPALEAEDSVVITANVAGSVGRATLLLDQPATFLISAVDPNFGSPQGGDVVTVRGNGFEPPVRVTFGGLNAEVLSSGDRSIRVRTPASPSPPSERATVAVSVTINVNEADVATDTLNNAFTYSPGGAPPTDQPVVLSVSPTTGPNEGGTPVSIVGEGFQAPVQVEFGAQGTFLEAQVLSVSNNRIEVLSPAATGFGDALRNSSVTIRVRNVNSGFIGELADAFRYGTEVRITAISPGSGPYFGGDVVTIFGQGFDAPVAVSIGGAGQTPLTVTGSEITFRTVPPILSGCSNFSGAVSVVNIETGEGASGPTFTFLVTGFEPLIFKVTPNSGPEAGNTLVTIEGENLVDPQVEFGGRPAEVTSVAADGSQVQARSPFFPVTSLATEACDDNADGTQGTRYLPTPVDVTVSNRINGCSFTFTDAFSYIPADSSCRNDVGPTDPDPECSDGIDNDGDGDVDFPDDAECSDADDDDEAA